MTTTKKTVPNNKDYKSTDNGSLGIGGDEKYSKRRQQKQRQAVRQILGLVGLTAVVVCVTSRQLNSSPFDNPNYTSQKQPEAVRYQNMRHMLEQKRDKELKLQPRDTPGLVVSRSSGMTGLRNNNHDTHMQRLRGNLAAKAKEEYLLLYPSSKSNSNTKEGKLYELLGKLNQDLQENAKGGIRWIRPELLMSMDPQNENPLLDKNSRPEFFGGSKNKRHDSLSKLFFKVNRLNKAKMAWEIEVETLLLQNNSDNNHRQRVAVDYTNHAYTYPTVQLEPPNPTTTTQDKSYPPLRPLQEIMDQWPQDDLDHPPSPYVETLIHFDFQNATELQAARKFREAKVPFKLVNIPEVIKAGVKWTDEYLHLHFDSTSSSFVSGVVGGLFSKPKITTDIPPASGMCQESPNNFFAFYTPGQWNV
jgi:hypothetical protein